MMLWQASQTGFRHGAEHLFATPSNLDMQDQLRIHTVSVPRDHHDDPEKMERLLLKLARTQRQRDSQVARCKTLEACLTTYQAALIKTSQSPKKAPANTRRRHDLDRY